MAKVAQKRARKLKNSPVLIRQLAEKDGVLILANFARIDVEYIEAGLVNRYNVSFPN